MNSQPKQVFINLPIKKLQRSKAFFSELGFRFNEQFENETTTCMVVNDSTFVMLLKEERFQAFTKREIADTSKVAEAIVALSLESREEVDAIVNRALAAGATPYNEPQDHGFMYGWSFTDLDGHLWEFLYMDEAAFEQQT